jgi:PleD family two-component response regulator
VLRFADQQLSVSVSMGVASATDNESPQSTLVRADEALYRAKNAKGNRERSVQYA